MRVVSCVRNSDIHVLVWIETMSVIMYIDLKTRPGQRSDIYLAGDVGWRSV